jgi:hypothetical protein
MRGVVLAELWGPDQFDTVACYVRPEDLDVSIRISADPQRHLAWLQHDLALGVSQINPLNVNREQEALLDGFGPHVRRSNVLEHWTWGHGHTA